MKFLSPLFLFLPLVTTANSFLCGANITTSVSYGSGILKHTLGFSVFYIFCIASIGVFFYYFFKKNYRDLQKIGKILILFSVTYIFIYTFLYSSLLYFMIPPCQGTVIGDTSHAIDIYRASNTFNRASVVSLQSIMSTTPVLLVIGLTLFIVGYRTNKKILS